MPGASAPTPIRPGTGRQRTSRSAPSGVGLCRTEHMFFVEDRRPDRRYARNDPRRHGRGAAGKALDENPAASSGTTFTGMFKELKANVRRRSGSSIRPFTSFCPQKEDTDRRSGEDSRLTHPDRSVLHRPRLTSLQRVEGTARDQNPMLGFRGCRLGISLPGDHRCHAGPGGVRRRRHRRHQERRVTRKPEIMIPLVGHVQRS